MLPPPLPFAATVTAIDDTITSFGGGPIVFNVLENDTAEKYDTLTLLQATPPAVGQLKVSADGSARFEPPTGWSRETTLSYIVESSNGATDTALVTIVAGESTLDAFGSD